MSTGDVARSPTASSAARQINSHTGLRGIAALLVVAYHHQFGSFHRLWLENDTYIFRRSYLMVDLFFVLSGFILSYVYVADSDQRWSKRQTKAFWFARFARVYPLHLFALLLITFIVVAKYALFSELGRETSELAGHDIVDWFLQLTLLHSWFPGHVGWNIPSWSISAEMFAYFLFPAIVAVYRYDSRASQVILLALPLTFYSYCILDGGNLDITAGLAPFRCVAGFSIGMLLYYYRHSAAGLSAWWLSALQLIGLIAFLAVLFIRVPDPLVIPAVAMIVWSTWNDRGLLALMLSTRAIQWLGDISYSVYLLHVPLITGLLVPWLWLEPRLNLDPDLARVIWLGISFTVVLSASTLTYKFVEVPARYRLVRWWKDRDSAKSQDLIPAP